MPRFAQITLIFTVFLLAHLSTAAAVYTVNKVADTNDGLCDSDCSLREAIASANASAENDEIVFDSVVFHAPQTIVLTGGELVITNNGSIALYGPGSSKLTIDGNQASRILTILGLANAKISGFTFTRGNGVSATSTGRAGAIYNFGGTTVIYSSVITGNTAANGGGLNNAADSSTTPDSPGNLTLVNTVVSNNVASGSGGGMQNFSTSTVTIINSLFTGNISNGSTGGGGGAFNGSVNIVNSTFSGNSAPAGSGGGIQSNGTLPGLLTNVTVTNNSSLNNGGLHRGSTNVNFSVRNSIFAGNNGTAASPDVTNSAGGLVSLGNNLVGTVGTSTGWVASDLLNVNPVLGPFGSHGGTVRTHPLLSGSPALNAGQACVLDLSCASSNPPVAVTTDNRYFPRGIDAGVDIGAYEKSNSSFAILPNGGLNQPYSHTITANATGFIYAVLPGGQLPPGLNLTTNGNEVLISGTPTQAGTYSFPLGLAKLPTLTETETVLYTITVSNDPNNVVFSTRFTFNGGALPEKFYGKLTNIDGRSTNLIIPPLGYVYLEKITPNSAWLLSIRSKRLGEASAPIAGHGSVVIPEVELAPPILVPTFRVGLGETKKR